MNLLTKTYNSYHTNTHTYQYDANGNLTYVATGRKMKDGHTEDLISERKLLWDDENRLMAISDNGYVSTYRYDDAGNRTVKLSGNGNAVFVCASDSSNGFTQTDRFTAYPNPYMVYNGSKYFKHIYVGSERIVSKVSANNPDYDPRQVDCAGDEITGYNVKLQSQQQALSDSIASIYAKLEVPYYPNNNDDYGYNWSDGLRRSVPNPDGYGELAYFYHSDHLGSTSYVTDANGEVSQHVEYVPFGEVFIEERNNTWNTPYLFNAKELDEETGLYYYGARYYDPRTSLWLSTDPMELKYPNVSTYVYCGNNPINRVDVDGKFWDVVWDLGNIVYDVGAATYYHIIGNHDTAKEYWCHAGVDLVAATLPFVPAGASKIAKGADEVVEVVNNTTKTLKTTEKSVEKVSKATKSFDDIISESIKGAKTSGRSKIYRKKRRI